MMRIHVFSISRISSVVLLSACLLSACSSVESTPDVPQTRMEKKRAKTGTLSGNEQGFTLFGGKKTKESSGDTGIGVNAFLWKASLDTISFMPLTSADPFGGVIITDWYTPAATPNERTKVNIFIRDTALRSDGVKVSLFKQVQQGGTWRDVPSSDAAARQLENAILTRARQLKIEQAAE